MRRRPKIRKELSSERQKKIGRTVRKEREAEYGLTEDLLFRQGFHFREEDAFIRENRRGLSETGAVIPRARISFDFLVSLRFQALYADSFFSIMELNGQNGETVVPKQERDGGSGV